MIFVHRTSITTSTRIILIAILIAHLSTTLSTAILSSLGKALVEIGANDALVQLRAANVLHAVECVLVRVVLDEAEAAGRFLEAVEAHYEALDFAAFGEEFVDLFFGCIEGQVSYVERRSIFELLVRRWGALVLVFIAAVALSSALLCSRIRTRLVQSVHCASYCHHYDC